MIELQNFGRNVETLSFLLTMAIMCIITWGLIHQTQKIWRNRSGESISTTWIIVFQFMFASFVVYGVEKNSLALIIQGCVRVPLVSIILLGLWKFKGFTNRQMAIFIILFGGIIYMPFSNHKAFIFLLYSYLGVASAMLQTWELWKTKHTGVVSIKFLMLNFIGVFLWVIYGSIVLDDPAVQIMGLSYCANYSVTIALWFKYRKNA